MSTWQKCCRGRRSSCPHFMVEGRTIHIRDDEGKIITMTLDQFQDVHLRLTEIIMQRPLATPADLAPLGLVP